MKKVFLFYLVFLFWSPFLKADYGNMIVYYAQFHLKDGNTLTGLFEYYDEFMKIDENGSNEYCNDEGIFRLFKQHQKRRASRVVTPYTLSETDFGKAIVYQKMNVIIPKGNIRETDIYGNFQDGGYGFVEEGDIFFIDSTEVEQMTFLKAEYSRRAWYTSEIAIVPFDTKEVMQNQKYWNQITVRTDSGIKDSLRFSKYTDTWGYHLINYNPQNNIAELKRLANLKLKFLTRPNPYWEALKEEENITPEMELMAREKFERDIQVVKDWFWERGIVMVRVNGTC